MGPVLSTVIQLRNTLVHFSIIIAKFACKNRQCLFTNRRRKRHIICLVLSNLLLLLLLLLLQPFNGLFSTTTWVSRYQKGKTSLDLNEARDDLVLVWQWQQLDHMQTICTSLQTDNYSNTLSLNFYRPDSLPGAQTTVSKH